MNLDVEKIVLKTYFRLTKLANATFDLERMKKCASIMIGRKVSAFTDDDL